jgi:hypothetical protein
MFFIHYDVTILLIFVLMLFLNCYFVFNCCVLMLFFTSYVGIVFDLLC